MGVIMALQNPLAFQIPSLRSFLVQAFERLPDVFEDPEAAIGWLQENCQDPEVGIFLAMDDRMEFQGVIAMSAQGRYPLSPHPWGLYIYAEKSPHARTLLIRSMLEWMRARGYKRFLCHNASPMDDEEFLKVFNEAKGRVVASVIEFEVGE